MAPQLDSIRRFFDALEAHDIEAAMRVTGEGFSVEAPGHYPLSLKDFCKTQLAVWAAFPDLRYGASDIRETLSIGEATVRLSGTFLHDLAHGTDVDCRNGCSAHHGFGHHQAEWFGCLQRVHERARAAEQLPAGRTAQPSDVLH